MLTPSIVCYLKMHIHILLVLIAAGAFKLTFGWSYLHALAGVAIAYLLGLLPWMFFTFIETRFSKKLSPIERFMKYAQTPDFRKRSTLANQIFKTWPELPSDAALRKSEIRDLKIRVRPDKSDDRKYVVQVTNTGKTPYENIAIDLREILLSAESFGLDTTHMPEDMQYAQGAPVRIAKLRPKETASMEITGYGTHDRYDLDRVRYAPVSFDRQVKEQTDMPYWSEVIVDLPEAKG
jgi:hypothetical protein